MKKLMLLAALAVGYVLGARAGRERYDQIMGLMGKIKDDPRVQEKAHQAVDLAKGQAPVVADKVSTAASAAASKVTGHGHTEPTEPNGARPHHMAGPQGDLP
jgi:hypothetical protein